MSGRDVAMVCLAWAVWTGPTATGENWPQWRGPFFNGSTTETGLPDTWSKTENVKWVAKMPGRGASTPVVWDDRVFVSALERGSKRLWALCLSRRDGQVLWRGNAGTGFENKRGNSAASPSAVTDGQRVIFLFGTGALVAYDMAGQVLWQRNIARDHGAFKILWRYGASPLLYEGRLYVAVIHSHGDLKAQPGQPKPASYLLCIDPATGKDRWKHIRETDAAAEAREAYITPYPFVGPRGLRIILTGADHVTAHDPATGREIWRSANFNPGKQRLFRAVASAVGVDRVVVAAVPRGGSIFAIRAGGEGKLTPQARAWSLRRGAPDVPTPLVMDGKLFVLDGRHKTLTCLDPQSGRVHWKGNLAGKRPFQASPTGADGKIYCVNMAGEAVVLSAGDEFKVLSRIAMNEGDTRATISAAHGQLFLRTGQNLYCIAKQAGGP